MWLKHHYFEWFYINIYASLCISLSLYLCGLTSACETLTHMCKCWQSKLLKTPQCFWSTPLVMGCCRPHSITSPLLILACLRSFLTFKRCVCFQARCSTYPVNDLNMLSSCWWMVKSCIWWWSVFQVAPLAMNRRWMDGSWMPSLKSKWMVFHSFLPL